MGAVHFAQIILSFVRKEGSRSEPRGHLLWHLSSICSHAGCRIETRESSISARLHVRQEAVTRPDASGDRTAFGRRCYEVSASTPSTLLTLPPSRLRLWSHH